MSFNRLPDELVSQMASHLNHEDVINLAQSQKRIYNILKRNKLMKPSIAFLRVAHPYFMSIAKETKVGPSFRIQPHNPGAEKEDIALECVTKFRSIELLAICGSCMYQSEDELFQLNNMLVEKLAETKVKIRKFELQFGKVDLSCDQFVHFCKKFHDVSFFLTAVSPTLICDKTICEILTSTNVDLTVENLEAVDLSDKTLQAIIANGKSASRLRLPQETETKFTIAGIRELFENIFNKDWTYFWRLGMVNNQFDEAMNWKNYADQHPELPYVVDVVEFPDGTMDVEVVDEANRTTKFLRSHSEPCLEYTYTFG